MATFLPRRSRSLAALLSCLALLSLAVPAAAAAPRPGTSPGRVYFMMDALPGGPGPSLVPVHRTLDATLPATTAMQALLEGPTLAESTSVPGISSAIPAGVELLGISISGGVATIDLTGDFDDGGGTLSMTARLAQVVFTLTQFPTVDGVRFELDGIPTWVFGGEGIIVGDPSARSEYLGIAPAILLEEPAYGGAVANPARITGIANTFEATFWATIVDGDGLIVAETVVHASAGTGTWGTFDATIPYTVTDDQIGSIIVWEASPQDGRPINVREHPVHLTAGGWCAGVRATILGTHEDDRLQGTPGRDVVAALGGDDSIATGDGRDLVCAGAGDDVVRSGPGADRVLGELGDDVLLGAGGPDVLQGGPGLDILVGGPGDDRLVGGPGFDTAVGGSGDDVCRAEETSGC